MNEFNLFTISFYALNLLSFMLGMTFSFFQQGLFGKKIGKYVIGYWILLAITYFVLYYTTQNNNNVG